jgi:pyridoxine 5-phosphate synthase
MSLLLGVNIDHVATLRQARYALLPGSFNAEPSPLEAAHDSILGGADSITIHVRSDRRHMQDADARAIRREISVPLNFEMGITEEMIGFALGLRPEFACLVPETREEVTTEGGLDIVAKRRETGDCIRQLQAAGIKVSLFIDPDLDQVRMAAELGAEMIELHTGCFANAEGHAIEAEVQRLIEAAKVGHAAGLQVNAGHGISYDNLFRLFAVPYLTELNIGHSIVSRAMKVGLTEAVRQMKQLIATYPEGPCD